MTWGFSRDDAPKFIPTYIEKGVLAEDPFITIDKCVIAVQELEWRD